MKKFSSNKTIRKSIQLKNSSERNVNKKIFAHSFRILAKENLNLTKENLNLVKENLNLVKEILAN